MSPHGWRWWPRTLFARLTLILFVGLALAHALSFQLVAYERSQAGMSMMLGNLEQNLASAVALLDRLPAAERSNWLPFLARDNYRLQLDAGTSGPPADTLRTRRVVAAIAGALGPRRHVSANLLPGASDRLQVHLRLRDGILAAAASACATGPDLHLYLARSPPGDTPAGRAGERRRHIGSGVCRHAPSRKRTDGSRPRGHGV
jgi:hypothetical protein